MKKVKNLNNSSIALLPESLEFHKNKLNVFKKFKLSRNDKDLAASQEKISIQNSFLTNTNSEDVFMPRISTDLVNLVIFKDVIDLTYL